LHRQKWRTTCLQTRSRRRVSPGDRLRTEIAAAPEATTVCVGCGGSPQSVKVTRVDFTVPAGVSVVCVPGLVEVISSARRWLQQRTDEMRDKLQWRSPASATGLSLLHSVFSARQQICRACYMRGRRILTSSENSKGNFVKFGGELVRVCNSQMRSL